MSRRQIETVVAEVATDIAERQEIELVDVEYVKVDGEYFLRVYIDKPDGIGLDDCQGVSAALGDRLDELDPIPGSYSLEVSSPGARRPLKKLEDFRRFAGREVELSTYAPIDGRKRWQGRLLGIEGAAVHLEVDGEKATLPFEKIARANLVAEF